jgi:integrase
MKEVKKDIYNNKRKYLAWKNEVNEFGIDGITKANSDIIRKFISDMEEGRNVAKASKKGGRSYTRLNTLRIRLIFVAKTLEKRGVKNLAELDEKTITSLFYDMRKGVIRTKDDKVYKSTLDYVKVFNSFWHWWMKVNKREEVEVKDITEEIDTSKDENSFVYFTKEQLEEMMEYFSQDEQVRMLFMFDTIIRSPTELMNIKLHDLTQDFKEVTIREEISKTYGRTIKLLLCSEELKAYVERNRIEDGDYLFEFSAPMFNQKLKKIAKKVLGDKMSKGGKRFSELTMYDFRHSGSCHWRTGGYRTKIDALMYRGGWSNLSMLNYYTKKIGMKDSIEKDDLLIEVDKHELEKQITELKQKGEAQNKLLHMLAKQQLSQLKGKEKKAIMEMYEVVK